jgi:hypothetical protein
MRVHFSLLNKQFKMIFVVLTQKEKSSREQVGVRRVAHVE